jgi:hypothetical protein
MNILDFGMGLAVLYLSLKMGQSELREKLLREEQRNPNWCGQLIMPGHTKDRKNMNTQSLKKILLETQSLSA